MYGEEKGGRGWRGGKSEEEGEREKLSGGRGVHVTVRSPRLPSDLCEKMAPWSVCVCFLCVMCRGGCRAAAAALLCVVVIFI